VRPPRWSTTSAGSRCPTPSGTSPVRWPATSATAPDAHAGHLPAPVAGPVHRRPGLTSPARCTSGSTAWLRPAPAAPPAPGCRRGPGG